MKLNSHLDSMNVKLCLNRCSYCLVGMIVWVGQGYWQNTIFSWEPPAQELHVG